MKEHTRKDLDNQEHKTDVQEAGHEQDANMTAGGEISEELSGKPEEKLQSELAEQKEKYLRLYAEFDNYKRRTAR